MEIVVEHHRNHHHYDGRNRRNGPAKFRSFGSAPRSNIHGINCRSYQSGVGLLPTPLRTRSSTTPVSNKSFAASPKTPSLSDNENHKGLKRSSSSMNPTPIKINFDSRDDELSFFERWAGPAYSNSPPPSSLPMPKFSMRPKRSVSLDLPRSDTKYDFRPVAKSAPASPTRDRSPSPSDLFDTSDSATKTLRRILNLDITDE